MVAQIVIISREERMSKRDIPYVACEAKGLGELDGLFLFPNDMKGRLQLGDTLPLIEVRTIIGYEGRAEYRLTFSHLGMGVLQTYLPKFAVSYSLELRKISAYLDELENTCPHCGRSCTHKEN